MLKQDSCCLKQPLALQFKIPLRETAEPAAKNSLLLNHMQIISQGLSVPMDHFLRGMDVFALYNCVWEFLVCTVKNATHKH